MKFRERRLKERFKTFFLAGLILLSLYLTYILWFGGQYLQEVVLPRYEEAFFTPVLAPAELLPPVVIALQQQGREEILLFKRGERGHIRIWQAAYAILQRKLTAATVERVDEEALAALLQEASFELYLSFNPPLPENFLLDNVLSPAEFQIIRLWARGDDYFILLEGSEKDLYRWVDTGGKELENLISPDFWEGGAPAGKLPSRFYLWPSDADESGTVVTITIAPEETEGAGDDIGDLNGRNGDGNKEIEERKDIATFALEETEATGEAFPAAPAGETEEKREEELHESWEIAVRGQIFIPAEPAAPVLLLEKEQLPWSELLSAFFLDPAMARRIEERDGATYYTDGKRGLRIYAGGALEYSAPGLEVFNNRLAYSTALLQAAENQSLYGGWPEHAFLERREKTAAGYRFFWHSYAGGLPLIGEESSSEMLVNDRGMPYYRRSFYSISEEGKGEPLPYRHYGEALWQAISLHREQFPNRQGTLLALEPVYRLIPEAAGARGIPAWAVHFAETGKLYLHWRTLEPL